MATEASAEFSQHLLGAEARVGWTGCRHNLQGFIDLWSTGCQFGVHGRRAEDWALGGCRMVRVGGGGGALVQRGVPGVGSGPDRGGKEWLPPGHRLGALRGPPSRAQFWCCGPSSALPEEALPFDGPHFPLLSPGAALCSHYFMLLHLILLGAQSRGRLCRCFTARMSGQTAHELQNQE